MVLVRQPLELAPGCDNIVEGALAARPEGERTMAQAIARRLAVLLDVTAQRERTDQALHDRRAEARAAGELADADIGAFGRDHLQYVEAALQRLRPRRLPGAGFRGAQPRRQDDATRGHGRLERGPPGPLNIMMRTGRSALLCAGYRYIVSIVSGSQVSCLSVNSITTNRLHRAVRLAGPGIAQPRSR